jgi:hypothetical protein
MQCGLCWMLSITACVLCDNWHAGSGCCQPCCTHPHCHAQTEQRHTRCHECLMYAPDTCRPRAGTNWLLWYVARAGAGAAGGGEEEEGHGQHCLACRGTHRQGYSPLLLLPYFKLANSSYDSMHTYTNCNKELIQDMSDHNASLHRCSARVLREERQQALQGLSCVPPAAAVHSSRPAATCAPLHCSCYLGSAFLAAAAVLPARHCLPPAAAQRSACRASGCLSWQWVYLHYCLLPPPLPPTLRPACFSLQMYCSPTTSTKPRSASSVWSTCMLAAARRHG